MFAKMKAWAAALWLSIKFELNGGREAELIDQLRDALDQIQRYKDQIQRYKDQIQRYKALVEVSDEIIEGKTAECRGLHDLARERFQEIERLKAIRKGLESDAAILVRRQKEDAAKMLEESHVKANAEILQLRDQKEYDAKTHELLANERDKHMRAAAECQGQCKRMSEVMRALRHVIEVVTDGKPPEQWFAMTLAELMSTTGNTSATDPVTAGSVWPDTSEFTDPASPLKSTTKTARYLEPALEELPATEPDIATMEKLSSIQEASEVIQSLLIEMHPGMSIAWWQKSMEENSPAGRALKWLRSHVRSGNIDKVRGILSYAIADRGDDPGPVFGEVDPVDKVLASHIGDVLKEMNRGRLAAIENELGQGMQPSPEQLADEARQYQQAAKLWPNGPKG